MNTAFLKKKERKRLVRIPRPKTEYMKEVSEVSNVSMYSFRWITWPKTILHTDFHNAGKSLKFDTAVRFLIVNTF